MSDQLSPEAIVKVTLSLMLNRYVVAARLRSTHTERMMAVLACGAVTTLCAAWAKKGVIDKTQQLGFEALARDMISTITGLKRTATFEKVTAERLETLRQFLIVPETPR